MSENVAEMPKVDDAIPTMQPGESPEEFKARLLQARQPVHPDDELLKKMAEGTYRDEVPKKQDSQEN